LLVLRLIHIIEHLIAKHSNLENVKNLNTLGIELLKEAKNASEIEKILSAWKSPINREHWVTENKGNPPIELSMELKADTLIEALTKNHIIY